MACPGHLHRSGGGCAPVVRAFGIGYIVSPRDLSIRQRYFNQLGVVFIVFVECVGKHGIDADDGGVFERGGEKMLLFAFRRGAIPADLDRWQHFAGGKCLIHQGGSFVQ